MTGDVGSGTLSRTAGVLNVTRTVRGRVVSIITGGAGTNLTSATVRGVLTTG